ncbi:hypothetical protein MRB53_006232 [Persea americana]|uniref:Uncharacterized protein n=1 Tax=Persea americana TaxID=3435 RepID=A0ACC2MFK0_PERAE|nr:hypothetical protein MRB53_006232 [Persea americana]
MFARQLKIATGTVYGFSEHMVAGFETEAHVNLTPKFYFLLLTTGSERRIFCPRLGNILDPSRSSTTKIIKSLKGFDTTNMSSSFQTGFIERSALVY